MIFSLTLNKKRTVYKNYKPWYYININKETLIKQIYENN